MAYCCQSAPLWTRLSEPYLCRSAWWASPSFREGSYEDALYSMPVHKNFNCDGYHANCQKAIQDWLCLQKLANPLQYQQHEDQHSYQSVSCVIFSHEVFWYECRSSCRWYCNGFAEFCEHSQYGISLWQLAWFPAQLKLLVFITPLTKTRGCNCCIPATVRFREPGPRKSTVAAVRHSIVLSIALWLIGSLVQVM